jgi:subtilisin family serine protease
MARRVPPAPVPKRKPQSGSRPTGHVLGGRLSHLLWVLRQEGQTALPELARRDKEAHQRRSTKNPLTASVRLRADEDQRLRLPGIGRFDPSLPSVAVVMEFLGGKRDLPALGAIAATRIGDIVSGWVNIASIPRLAAHPATLRLEAVQATGTPLGDAPAGDAPAGSGAPAAGPTGKGVRLAVIDNGFDFLHPAFLHGEPPRVRTKLLHDMVLAPPEGAPPGSLGRRFSEAELQASLDWYLDPTRPLDQAPAPVALHLARLDSSDSDSRRQLRQHGTAVLGIAAGNGRGAGLVQSEAGVAPDAEPQLYAIGLHDERRFADVTEVHAAFEAAFRDAGLAPCVALMANSDNLGPHDGSLDGEIILDELLLLPGRAIVLTAGNQNHTDPPAPGCVPPLHALLEPGSTEKLQLRFDSGVISAESAEVWFQPPAGSAASVTISATIRGATIGPVTLTEAAALHSGALPGWTTILDPSQNQDGTLVVALLQPDPEAGAHVLRLVFRPVNGPDIAPSLWTIEPVAEGPVHGWLDRNSGGLARWEGAAAQAGASRTTIGSPACATRPVTVGSVVRPQAERHQRKPELVACGEGVRGPLGWPAERVLRQAPPGGVDYANFAQGTSYAAPQVAGLAVLAFERFGPPDPLLGHPASWADIRQALLLESVRRPGMPAPDEEGWDPACGYGLADPGAGPCAPEGPDLWIAKDAGDAGAEPFVAWRFWSSPDLALLDGDGGALDPRSVALGEAVPAQLRIRVANRGVARAEGVRISAWWAPLGALHPLPQPGEQPGGAWRAVGSAAVETLDAGAAAEVTLLLPSLPLPCQLLAALDTAGDSYDPAQPFCATNNIAVLTLAATRRGMTPPCFTILGSEGADGAVLWTEGTGLLVENLPLAAIPWRQADVFLRARRRWIARPLHGDASGTTDAALLAGDVELTGEEIEEVTDIQGATRLVLRSGKVSLEAGPKLVIPRLRITESAKLEIHASAEADLHMLHLSGGRRVGGGTIRVV